MNRFVSEAGFTNHMVDCSRTAHNKIRSSPLQMPKTQSLRMSSGGSVTGDGRCDEVFGFVWDIGVPYRRHARLWQLSEVGSQSNGSDILDISSK